MFKKHINLTLLLIVCTLLGLPRFLFMFTDPDYRTFFVEEKASGYASRNAELFDEWDSGGGRYQTSAYMPASTLITRASFAVFGVGIWQLRLPFVISSMICFICLGMILIRCCSLRMGLLLLAAFGSSPLLLSLNSTAVNENLSLSTTAFILLLLVNLEDNPIPEKERIIALLLGLCTFLSAMVKINDVVVVPAVAATFIIGDLGKEKAKRLLAFFVLGCMAGAVMFFLYVLTVPGLDRTLDIYRWFNEVWTNNKYNVVNLSNILPRFYLIIPKNLQALLSGFFFFAMLGVFLLPLSWRQQRLSVRFSLLLFLFSMFFLTSGAWIYWKRFIVVLVPLFYLAATFLCQLRNPEPDLTPGRCALTISMMIAAVLSTIAAVSAFSGHWKVIAPWAHPADAAFRVAIMFAVPLLVGGLAVFLRHSRKTLYAAGIIVSLTVIFNGTAHVAAHHWRYDSDKIGNAIASQLGEETVIADEQAFRYFAYYSGAQVSFMHENDPEFPDGVLELARTQKPTYIVASDAYRPIPDMVKKLLPEYKLIASYSYTQPLFFFVPRNKIQNISVFKRIK